MNKLYITLLFSLSLLSLGYAKSEKKDDFLSIAFQLEYSEASFFNQALKSGFSNDLRRVKFTQSLFKLYLHTGEDFPKVLLKFKIDRDMLLGIKDPLNWTDYFEANAQVTSSDYNLFVTIPNKGVVASQYINLDKVKITNAADFNKSQKRFVEMLTQKNKKELKK